MKDMEKSMEKWVWCLHCGRAFRYDGGMECAYEGCDGGYIDFIDWEEFKKLHKGKGIDTPEEPEEGVVYPLYPKKP